MDRVEVIQADRDAAADLIESIDRFASGLLRASRVRRGDEDDCPEVQAFARHRLAAEQAVRETWKVGAGAAIEALTTSPRLASGDGATARGLLAVAQFGDCNERDALQFLAARERKGASVVSIKCAISAIETALARSEAMREALEGLVNVVSPLKASGKRLSHVYPPLGTALKAARAALQPEEK